MFFSGKTSREKRPPISPFSGKWEECGHLVHARWGGGLIIKLAFLSTLTVMVVFGIIDEARFETTN